ncbi:MAG: hypothetical protein LBQ66_04175 [Planctomycetaceae bacterium]|nr:hypothetical protein [Planctomycetaceae bacterium]
MPNRISQRTERQNVLVNVRWATDRRAVVFSASGASRKQWIAKPRRQNQNAQNVGRVGFAGAFWRSNCRLAPTLFTKKAWQSVAHLTFPIRLGVPFKLFWCYYTQRRAGRPRSSPLPLRGNFFLAAKRRTYVVQRGASPRC